jgi:hypothetical protein
MVGIQSFELFFSTGKKRTYHQQQQGKSQHGDLKKLTR